MLSKEISKLRTAQEYTNNKSWNKYIFEISGNAQAQLSEKEADQLNYFQEILDRYSFPDLLTSELIPGLSWWQNFFDKGIVYENLQESILHTKYFIDQNTPNWKRLYYWYDSNLNDDEFEELRNQVELEYINREFVDLG